MTATVTTATITTTDVDGKDDGDSDNGNDDNGGNVGEHDDDDYNNGNVGCCAPCLHVLCIVFVQINMKLKLRLSIP